jgi:hypothetical protein
MCKKSSDAHLFNRDIIDFDGREAVHIIFSYMHDINWQLRNRSDYFVVV